MEIALEKLFTGNQYGEMLTRSKLEMFPIELNTLIPLTCAISGSDVGYPRKREIMARDVFRISGVPKKV